MYSDSIANDLLGQALKAYAEGNKTDFFWEDDLGELYAYDLAIFFKNDETITSCERKLIALATGKILEVGCSVGCYVTLLNQRGKTLGIDVSDASIDAARELGVHDVVAGDIYLFDFQDRFDTIALFGDNLGLGGSVEETKRLLNRLRKLLAPDGSILAILTTVPPGMAPTGFDIIAIKGKWLAQTGPRFRWIHFDFNFFSDLCTVMGLHCELMQSDDVETLVRIRNDKKA